MRQPIQCIATMLAVLFLAGSSIRAETTVDELLKRFDSDQNGTLDAAELRRAAAAGAITIDGQAALPATTAVAAQEPASELKFIRVNKDERGVVQSLETSVVSFESADGKTRVDLIGAVHIADKPYYEQLNRLFGTYDHVLYELVAPEGTRVPRGGSTPQHPVGKLQTGMKSMLDLSFQLDEIDYTVPRLVHADLSPEEFSRKMKERGESFFQILLRAIGQASSQAQTGGGASDADLFMALFAADRPLRLKRILAEQFEDLESQMNVFSGPDGSTLITERNKRALEVLQKRINLGDNRLAIFYGAGHMSDMAERLQRDFNMHITETRWLRAWDLTTAMPVKTN